MANPAAAQALAAQAIEQVLFQSYFSTVQMLGASLQSSAREMSTQKANAMLEALRGEAIPRSWRQAMWDEIGANAQASMVAAYQRRRFQRHTVYPQARTDRYANGALLRALESPGQFLATPFGLYFINTDILDQEARHWRRLNFGAGSGGREGITPPRRFQVTGLGLMIGLEPDRRPAFRIPRGMWISQSGQRVSAGANEPGTDAFYPGRTYRAPGQLTAAKMTRGIASRNFLDAPMQRIAKEIKPGLDRLWDRVRDNNSRTTIVKAKTGYVRLPT